LPCVAQFRAHDEAIRCGQLILASGKYCVLTGSMDGRVRLWSLLGDSLG